MKTLNEFFNQQMQDPEFRSEYEKIQPEMDIIRAIVDARLSQNLTQKELAERTGINPATKEKITIPAKKVVKFKAGAELTAKVK